MGEVIKVGAEGTLFNPGTVEEFIAAGNTGRDQDGNKRHIMVAGKLQTQERIAGVWTALEEI